MKVEYLKEFYTLADLLNYTRAAAEQYISQPSLTRHIHLLEDELGVRLLERNTKKVELTPAGEILQHALHDILPRLNETLSELNALAAHPKRSLCIGFPAVSVNDYLGNTVQVFQSKYPDVAFMFFSGSPEVCIQSIMTGEADIILIGNVKFPKSDLFTFQNVKTERYIVICKKDDPLASRRTVRLEDLIRYRLLQIDSAYNLTIWGNLQSVAQSINVTLNRPTLLSCMDAVLIAIRQGMGITIVGEHQASLAVNGLTSVALGNESLTRNIALAYKTSNTNPCIPQFIKIFRKHGYGGTHFCAQ